VSLGVFQNCNLLKTGSFRNHGVEDESNCGVRNTFNRASDLQTFQPIGLKTVTCQACKALFNIKNDTITAAHEMLLFGCYAFIERKEYMQCVLSVAQAYEVFFSHFIQRV